MSSLDSEHKKDREAYWRSRVGNITGECKYSPDEHIPAEWKPFTTLGSDFHLDIEHATSVEEAVEILKTIRPSSEYRNMRKMTEKECDIFY